MVGKERRSKVHLLVRGKKRKERPKSSREEGKRDDKGEINLNSKGRSIASEGERGST